MSKDKIIQAALKRFTEQGYDATSLSEIADDVGIRKPSIYSHFQAKQEIFLLLLEESFRQEKICINKLDSQFTPAIDALKEYLFNIPARYDGNYYLHFWLRAIYMPPPSLENEIKNYDNSYADLLDATINTVMRKGVPAEHSDAHLVTASNSYIGILRGTHAELLYKGRKNAEIKTKAMWDIFALFYKIKIEPQF